MTLTVTLKRGIAMIIVMILAFSVVPVFNTDAQDALATDAAKAMSMMDISLNPEGSVDADYVVITNPSGSTLRVDLTDFTTTEAVTPQKSENTPYNEPFHPQALEDFATDYAQKAEFERTVNEGDKRVFNIYDTSSGTIGTKQREFLAASLGENCCVWMPTASDETHLITVDMAKQLSAEFDRIYPLMSNAFGSMTFPTSGNGKVNLMFYDLHDYDPANGDYAYTGGFFWPSDISTRINGEAMLHINTYPSIYNESGANAAGAYSIIVHEFQHLINFVHTSSNPNGAVETDRWLNECMSMSAEEMIRPGAALPDRTAGWFNDGKSYHEGMSLYNWSNGSLGAYAIACLFGQYLRVQTGDYTVFKTILNYFSTQPSPKAVDAIEASVAGSVLEGMSSDQINDCFRIALNAPAAYGPYGFNGIKEFSGMAPVFVTGSLRIASGGAVTVKPVIGKFNYADWGIPEGLNCYVIITNDVSINTSLYGFSDSNWIQVAPNSRTVASREISGYTGVTAAEYYDENVYGYTQDKFFVANHITMQPTYTEVDAVPNDMCYDYRNGIMYAVLSNKLYHADMNNGALTDAVTLDVTPVAVCCTSEGKLYVLADNSGTAALYTVNATNGKCKLIGNTGVSMSGKQSITYEHDNGVLYWSADTGDKANLYVIDTDNANTNLVIYNMPQTVALYSIPTTLLNPSIQWLTYGISGGTVNITKCSREATGEVIIPATLEGYPVVKISTGAFSSCTNVTDVRLPEGLTEIASNAFSGCTGIKKMLLPSTLNDISNSAFSGCKQLTQLVVASGSETYSSVNGALYSADVKDMLLCPEGIDGTFTFPESVTSVKSCAFKNCTAITSVELPVALENIGSSAFSGCTGLHEISLPSTLKYIGEQAFVGCANIAELVIPDTVTSISSHAFENCTGLITLTLPKGITKLSNYTFYNCSQLYFVNFTEDCAIDSIGSYAFAGCSDLVYIKIPACVSKISGNAFLDCSHLSYACFEGNAPDLGNNVFSGCSNSFSVYCKKNAEGFTTPKWNDYACAASETLPNMPDAEYVPGDANNDGVLNTGDAVKILKYSVNTSTLGYCGALAADINGDGTVNTGDATQVLRTAVNS